MPVKQSIYVSGRNQEFWCVISLKLFNENKEKGRIVAGSNNESLKILKKT